MRISTVIPAYNRADLIGDTLRSVLEQSRPPAEVVVVDDGSTDGTPEVVEAFGKAVTLIRQANAGAGAARNAGFRRTTGDIIHFMDSDDISSLNTYAVQAAALEAGADMVYGPWLKTRFEGRSLSPEGLVIQQGPVPPHRPLDQMVLAGRWITVFQPCLFRRALIESAGPYRTDLKPSEDTEMLYRLTREAKAAAHTRESIVLYRVHPEGQVSVQNVPKRLIDLGNLWTVMSRHLDQRSDLDAWTVRQVRLRRLDAAMELASIEPQLAATLMDGTGAEDRIGRLAQRAGDRIGGKLRQLLSGDRTGGPFSPASISEGQRREIAALGYTLPTD